MRKPIQIIAIIVVILSILSTIISCGIKEYIQSVEFEYVIEESTNTITITGIKSDHGTVIIPNKIEGYTVTKIADYAFKDNNNIVNLTVPSTISYIGEGAFYNCARLVFVYNLEDCSELIKIEDSTFCGCSNLYKILLPAKIVSIGDYAFKSCSNLQELSLPNTVVEIGQSAFDNCQSIKEFVIPEGVTFIKPRTFFACTSLTKITIPTSVNTISTEVFDYDTSLKEIYVEPNNKKYASVGGVLYSKDITQLIHFPSAKECTTFEVPETVTVIKQCSFALSVNLESLYIPTSVTSLESGIFIDSSIKNIYFDGTIDEWNRINKSGIWDTRSPSFIIYCTDGQIAKDGTVTYK